MCWPLRGQARSHRGSRLSMNVVPDMVFLGYGLGLGVQAGCLDLAAITFLSIAAGGDFVDRPATAHEVWPGGIKQDDAFGRQARMAGAADGHFERFAHHAAGLAFGSGAGIVSTLVALAQGLERRDAALLFAH